MKFKGLIPDILVAGGQQRAETPSTLHITIIKRHNVTDRVPAHAIRNAFPKILLIFNPAS